MWTAKLFLLFILIVACVQEIAATRENVAMRLKFQSCEKRLHKMLMNTCGIDTGLDMAARARDCCIEQCEISRLMETCKI